MNERDCLLLQYIFEEQNLTRAAERLYITQPALTYRVHLIEKEFGVSILAKKGKGFKLTPEGEYLVSYANKLLIELRKTKNHLASMQDEIQGSLRIGFTSYFGRYHLLPLLREFNRLYPKIDINVDAGLSSELFELLLDEDIHVAIIRGDYKWFDEKYLLHEERICLISKEEIQLDQLPSLPRIVPKIDRKTAIKYKEYTYSSLHQTIESWWNENYIVPPNITMKVDSYETCKEMVINHLGYAIVPRVFAKPEDGLYCVDLIGTDGQPITRKTWMLYRQASLQFNVVTRFVEYIKSQSTN
ncbi:LysR family transcriptional regulator [Brevibacillus sp. 179-C 1.1 NHS]|uniref:LysR family transcriptional regulator n=1 Tax=Brevibacillus sp. 179-C 1.1 NHS TaxID=3235177 RepID=UPI0039A10202